MEVHVNAAVSADGKLSTVAREQIRISGRRDMDRVESLRAGVDGIMVGVGTVLADDPQLTVSDPGRGTERQQADRPTQPTRIVADSRGRTALDARILDDSAPTIILVSAAAPAERIGAYEDCGATVIQLGEERVDVSRLPTVLPEHGIDSLLIEGGGEVLYSCFEAAIVDRLTLYVGSIIFGGASAPTLVDGNGFRDPESFPRLRRRSVEPTDDGVVLSWEVLPPD